ncbi:hypothetical protein VTK73DRAFT_7492 [Phialemonium thermophilum]|uniref:Uncharacterized protein n=1 Tax=Phialemonium thermophilum TaxID=223376 RepID=A0ABR3WEB2_9PEZI
MAETLHAWMMQQEAVKRDQILKRSIPLSIPVLRRNSSTAGSCSLGTDPHNANSRISRSTSRDVAPSGTHRPSDYEGAYRPASLELLSGTPPQRALPPIIRHRSISERCESRDLEAKPISEKGEAQDANHGGSRYSRGDGMSGTSTPSSSLAPACPHCLCDGHADTWMPPPWKPYHATEIQKVTAEEENYGDQGGEEEDDVWQQLDRIADRGFVLSLVTQIRQRAGYGEEESPVQRARQVEKAAMEVARLASVLREKMQSSGDSSVTETAADCALLHGLGRTIKRDRGTAGLTR